MTENACPCNERHKRVGGWGWATEHMLNETVLVKSCPTSCAITHVFVRVGAQDQPGNRNNTRKHVPQATVSGGCVTTTPKQRNKATSAGTAGFMGLLRFLGNPCSSTVLWPTRAMAQLRGHLVQLCNFIATVFLSLAANEKCKARQHARSERATELVQIGPRTPPKQAGSTKHCFKSTL